MPLLLLLAFALLAVAALVALPKRKAPGQTEPVSASAMAQPQETAKPAAAETAAPAPTEAVVPTPTSAVEPQPTEAPALVALPMRPDAGALPDRPEWKYKFDLHIDGKKARDYAREAEIAFSRGEDYTALPGVITFRGGNFRQNAAYGMAKLEKKRLDVLWKKRIGTIDSGYTTWSGVGWNGQPVLVRWPEQTRRIMNLGEAYRNDDSLIEVIYGTLDGNIYFLDARTGEATRDAIRLGFPIKGSVSVDPRGYPLLYVGQGISKADGRTGRIGWRVYSLIDQRELFFLDGHDALCLRDHGAFDGVCLVDAETDTVIEGGENGIFYAIRLNTDYNPSEARISVNPEVTAYRYKAKNSTELGIENSVAAYGGYAWFADNSGLLTCLDLNAMRPVWLFDVGDDTDSSIALEPESGGKLALYTANQVDKQGKRGRCTVRRIDALSGIVEWMFSVECESDGENGGGGFASPAVGSGAYENYIYFNICNTEGGGMLYCFNKRTGEVAWSGRTGSGSWSSPVLVYREDGTGVLIVGNSGGRGILSMYDPATGKKLNSVDLKGKIEASPAIFGDILVVGTRDCEIYGVRLQ